MMRSYETTSPISATTTTYYDVIGGGGRGFRTRIRNRGKKVPSDSGVNDLPPKGWCQREKRDAVSRPRHIKEDTAFQPCRRTAYSRVHTERETRSIP